MFVYQVTPLPCLEVTHYDRVSVNGPLSYPFYLCVVERSHISEVSWDAVWILVHLRNHLWELSYDHELISILPSKSSSRLTSAPLTPTTSVNKDKCLKIRQDWMISNLVAWWSTVSQSLPPADYAHLLTHPRESSWIAMSDEFLPYSEDFSAIILTGLLSVPLRGKPLEKLSLLNFTF